MASQVIAIASPKGGTGKTVITASLGMLLVHLGFPVLVVDSDSATNGLTLLFLHDVVRGENRQPDRRRMLGLFDEMPGLPTPTEVTAGLDLIPAVYEMRQTASPKADRYRGVLETLLKRYADRYAYIILDLEAGTEPYLGPAFRLADKIVIVSEPDPVSDEGLIRFRALFLDHLTYHKTYILYNKCLDRETVLSTRMRSWRAQDLPAIPFDLEVMRAYSRREIAIDTDHGNIFTVAIAEITQRLLGKQIARRIEEWRNSGVPLLKVPVQAQLGKLDGQIEKIDRAQAQLRMSIESYRRRISPRFTGWTAFRLVRAGLLGGLLATSLLSIFLDTPTLYIVVGIISGPLLAAGVWYLVTVLRRATWKMTIQTLMEQYEVFERLDQETRDARERMRLLTPTTGSQNELISQSHS